MKILKKTNKVDSAFLDDLLDGLSTLTYPDETKRALTHLSEYELDVFRGAVERAKKNIAKVEKSIKEQEKANK